MAEEYNKLFDEILRRVSMKDLLESAGYKNWRKDGKTWPSFVRFDRNGKRIHGDKFFLCAHNKNLCFQPPQQKVYNVISFIKNFPDRFEEYIPGMNLNRLVNEVGERILGETRAKPIVTKKVQEEAKPIERKRFNLDNYIVTPYNDESKKDFSNFFASRGINSHTQEVFKDFFFLSRAKNQPSGQRITKLVFPLTKVGSDEIVGLDERGARFKGMAQGSNRSEGLWIANPHHLPLDEVTDVTWFEGAYDALAEYQLMSEIYGEDKMLPTQIRVSTSGTPTENQIKSLIQATPNAIHYVAFDKDSAGKQYFENFKNWAGQVGLKTDRFFRHVPIGAFKDWNDALTGTKDERDAEGKPKNVILTDVDNLNPDFTYRGFLQDLSIDPDNAFYTESRNVDEEYHKEASAISVEHQPSGWIEFNGSSYPYRNIETGVSPNGKDKFMVTVADTNLLEALRPSRSDGSTPEFVNAKAEGIYNSIFYFVEPRMIYQSDINIDKLLEKENDAIINYTPKEEAPNPKLELVKSLLGKELMNYEGRTLELYGLSGNSVKLKTPDFHAIETLAQAVNTIKGGRYGGFVPTGEIEIKNAYKFGDNWSKRLFGDGVPSALEADCRQEITNDLNRVYERLVRDLGIDKSFGLSRYHTTTFPDGIENYEFGFFLDKEKKHALQATLHYKDEVDGAKFTDLVVNLFSKGKKKEELINTTHAPSYNKLLSDIRSNLQQHRGFGRLVNISKEIVPSRVEYSNDGAKRRVRDDISSAFDDFVKSAGAQIAHLYGEDPDNVKYDLRTENTPDDWFNLYHRVTLPNNDVVSFELHYDNEVPGRYQLACLKSNFSIDDYNVYQFEQARVTDKTRALLDIELGMAKYRALKSRLVLYAYPSISSGMPVKFDREAELAEKRLLKSFGLVSGDTQASESNGKEHEVYNMIERSKEYYKNGMEYNSTIPLTPADLSLKLSYTYLLNEKNKYYELNSLRVLVSRGDENYDTNVDYGSSYNEVVKAIDKTISENFPQYQKKTEVEDEQSQGISR